MNSKVDKNIKKIREEHDLLENKSLAYNDEVKNKQKILEDEQKNTISGEISLFIDNLYDDVQKCFNLFKDTYNKNKLKNISFVDSIVDADINTTEYLIDLSKKYKEFYSLLESLQKKEYKSDKELESKLKEFSYIFNYIETMYFAKNRYLSLITKEENIKIDKLKAELLNAQNVQKNSVKNDLEVAMKKITPLINEIKDIVNDETAKLNSVIINNTPMVALEFSKDIPIVLGCEIIEEEKEKFPLFDYEFDYPKKSKCEINLTNSSLSNIVISAKEDERESKYLTEIMENIILRFIVAIPGEHKRICCIDGKKTGSNLSRLLGQIEEVSPGTVMKPKDTGLINFADRETEDVIRRINQIISNRKEKINDKQDILDYNISNPDNANPVVLLIINGFTNINDELISSLYEILKGNEKRYGIYVLFTMYESEKMSEKEKKILDSIKKEIFPACNTFEFRKDKLYKIKSKSEILVDCHIRSRDFDKENYVKNYGMIVKQHRNKVINLMSIVENDRGNRANEFSRVLEIPFGKDNGKVVSMELRDNHMMVIGRAGWGKSKFLQTLILSACIHYTPDELKMMIFDFKGGEFTKFIQFPHVSYMANHVATSTATEIIDIVTEEMNRRQRIIQNAVAGENNIYTYNNWAEQNGQPKLPRLLVIMDEYQDIVDISYIMHALSNIAKKGRSAGIYLIFASQDITKYIQEIRDIKSQCGNYIAFNCDDREIEMLMDNTKDKPTSHDIDSLRDENMKGVCIYNSPSGKRIVRVALPGTDTDGSYDYNINYILNKYKGYKCKCKFFDDEELRKQKEIRNLLNEVNDDLPSLSDIQKKQIKNNLLSNKYELNVNIGKTFITQEDVIYKINEKNSQIFIAGEREIADNVIMSFVKSITFAYESLSYKGDPYLYYIDLSGKRDRSSTCIKTLRNLQDEYAESGILDCICFVSGIDGFINVIKEIYERRHNDDEEFYPIEIIINNADKLDPTLIGEVFNEYAELLQNAKEFAVNFILHFDKFSYDTYSFKDIYYPKDLIILSENNNVEENEISSVEAIKTLQTAASSLGSMLSFEEIKSHEKALTEAPLLPGRALLMDDGRIRRLVINEYDDDLYAKSFVKKLYNIGD